MIRLALVLCLLAGGAAAQDIGDVARVIPVLSGEHQGFTRLSLQIGARRWQIGRTPRGYGLRLSPDGAVAVERVFATIGRNRIAEVVPDRTGVEIVLNCDCHMRSFRHQENWLVLDIVDGPPSSDSPYERPLPPQGGALPIIIQQDQPILPARLSEPPVPDPAAGIFETTLMSSLAEAARSGTVDPVTSLPEAVPVEVQPVTAAPPLPIPAQPVLNLHHDPYVEGEVLHEALPATACAGDESFDMRGWAGTDFTGSIAAAQVALAQAPDPRAAALPLVRGFIAYGFGQEAKQVLATYQVGREMAGFLPALADIVDGKTAPEAFVSQEGCRGDVIFWRALATGTLRHLDGEETGFLIETFRTLPPDLRRQLAPRVAGLFTAAGDPATAADVVKLLGGGEEDKAFPTENPRDPVLVANRVEDQLSRGIPPTGDDLQLIQSLRYEWRGTDAEPPLQALEARIFSALQLHPQAIATASGLPDPLRGPALTLAVEAYVADAPADSFLSTALTLPSDLSAPQVNRVAARLIADGFADLALRFLAPPATGEDMAERRYLRAEAAGHLGLVDMVESELLGLTDHRAESLRAAALATTPDASDYAWRRADLPALRESDDTLLQQTAQVVEGEPAPLPPTPLASRTALIARAEEARALANALLSRFSAPP